MLHYLKMQDSIRISSGKDGSRDEEPAPGFKAVHSKFEFFK